MKKRIALLLAAALVFCACGGKTTGTRDGVARAAEETGGLLSAPTDGEAQTITVASASFNTFELEQYINRFNGSQNLVHAELKQYSEPTQLLADFAAGNAPDVLDLHGAGIPLNGVNFVDMMPFLEADTGIALTDFSGNIIPSLKTDGKLLALTDGFSITTVTGRTKDVGMQSGWKMADVEQLSLEKSGDHFVFPPHLTAGEMMLWFCYVSMGQMIDWNAGQCHFDTPAFTEMLDFCAGLPRSYDASAGGMSEWSEKVLLVVETVSNPARLEAIRENYGTEAYTFIGFPNADANNGAYFDSTNNLLLAIPARSQKTAAAWAFVRGMLEADWQSRVAERWELPVIRSALDAMFDDYVISGEGILSDADKERFYRLLEETTIFIHDDDRIREIIMEEATAFLSGQRSAKEAAELVQNRVTVYLQEQYHR